MEEVELAVEVTIEEGDTIVASLLEVVTVEDIVVDPEDTHHIEIFQGCCWDMRLRIVEVIDNILECTGLRPTVYRKGLVGLKARRLSHCLVSIVGTGVIVS